MGITPGWRYGGKKHISSNFLSELILAQLTKLEEPGDVTMWMDLARTSRHPQHLWNIDYIDPMPELASVNNAIRKSEIMLYGDKRNLKLRKGYTADMFQEIAFHTIRAHLRAEEGNPEISVEIFEELIEEWFDDLPSIRKTNLLMHACLCFLCCKKFQQSYDCLQKHWGLLKYASVEDRESFGIWDNEIIIRAIYWFFMKHVPDFRNFYTSQTGMVGSTDIWKHKKTGFLWLISHDDSWAVSFCSLDLYNHARTLMTDLPIYEIKNHTVRNSIIGFSDPSDITEVKTEQSLYLDKLNEITSQSAYAIDDNKVMDALFSYLSFNENMTESANKIAKLISFLDSHGSQSMYFGNVIDVASGLSMTSLLEFNKDGDVKFTSNYLHVDVSERVCRLLQEQGRKVVHSSMENFMSTTTDKFDLCIASECLHYLLPCTIDSFLLNMSKKCSSLAALINLGDDIIKDVVDLSKPDSDPDATSHAFIATDFRCVIIDWSQKAEQLFGWTREEIIGNTLADTIIPDRYRKDHLQAMKGMQKSGKPADIPPQIKLPALHRDGHEFLTELSVMQVRSGETISFNAFIRKASDENPESDTPANLQRAKLTKTEWLDHIRKHFKTIEHKTEGETLYVYAK